MNSILENKLEALSSIKNEFPESSEAEMIFADYNFVLGNQLSALLAYQDIIAKNENVAAARLSLSIIYMQHELYNDAYAEILEVLKKDPRHKYAHLLYGFFQTLQPISEKLQKSFSNIASYDFSIPDWEVFVFHFDTILDLCNQELSEANAYIEENPNDLVMQYKKELSLERLSYFQMIRNYVSSHLSVLFEQQRLEEERIRLEAEEAERRRLEEEERIRLEAEEAERRRLEAERRRIEEEERKKRELEEKYGGVARAIESDFNAFAKNKGVSAVILLSQDSYIVSSVLNTEMNLEKSAEFILKAMSLIKKYHTPSNDVSELIYWVLEFEKGQIAFSLIDPAHIFVTFTDSMANFGVLKYSIDKMKEIISKALNPSN